VPLNPLFQGLTSVFYANHGLGRGSGMIEEAGESDIGVMEYITAWSW
jgi:hypothetical protein